MYLRSKVSKKVFVCPILSLFPSVMKPLQGPSQLAISSRFCTSVLCSTSIGTISTTSPGAFTQLPHKDHRNSVHLRRRRGTISTALSSVLARVFLRRFLVVRPTLFRFGGDRLLRRLQRRLRRQQACHRRRTHLTGHRPQRSTSLQYIDT